MRTEESTFLIDFAGWVGMFLVVFPVMISFISWELDMTVARTIVLGFILVSISKYLGYQNDRN